MSHHLLLAPSTSAQLAIEAVGGIVDPNDLPIGATMPSTGDFLELVGKSGGSVCLRVTDRKFVMTADLWAVVLVVDTYDADALEGLTTGTPGAFGNVNVQHAPA